MRTSKEAHRHKPNGFSEPEFTENRNSTLTDLCDPGAADAQLKW
jgi:hypothetical protein